jgi:hypothetical protein
VRIADLHEGALYVGRCNPKRLHSPSVRRLLESVSYRGREYVRYAVVDEHGHEVEAESIILRSSFASWADEAWVTP